MKRTLFVAAVLACLVAGAPGTGAQQPSPKRASVEAAGGPLALLWAWEPSSVTVAPRGVVTWVNEGSAPHNVASYGGMWDDVTLDLPSGTSARYRFKKPGTYLYRCTIPTHSEMAGTTCVGMCGEVVVE